MTEPEQQGVLELGMSVATMVGDEVVVVHVDALDPPGWFRVRRGPDVQTAYQQEPERVRVDGSAVPWHWAVLPDTGLEVKVLSAPAEVGWPVEPDVLRIGVRPRIKRERGEQ